MKCLIVFIVSESASSNSSLNCENRRQRLRIIQPSILSHHYICECQLTDICINGIEKFIQYTSFLYISFISYAVEKIFLLNISPQSAVLPSQSFRILGFDPWYSWNYCLWGGENKESNIVFFGMSSIGNLPILVITITAITLMMKCCHTLARREEWRWCGRGRHWEG